jgi:hypothetical protein
MIVSKNVSNDVEKVLGQVVMVYCLTHRQNRAFLGQKRRLRRPIPTLAFLVHNFIFRQ